MDSIPWVHHSREEGSLDYDGGFVRLQIHMNFHKMIYRQQVCNSQCSLDDTRSGFLCKYGNKDVFLRKNFTLPHLAVLHENLEAS
jgi:hypothetical protein